MIFYIVNYIFIIRSKKMTNNLRNLQKDLRAFAKKAKDFKYTDSALVTFLMTGVVSRLQVICFHKLQRKM